MNQPAPTITGFFRNYLRVLIPLIIAATLANGLGLVIPALISKHIDIYQVSGSYNFNLILLELIGITVAVALFTLIQSALATFTAEKMAYDLRDQLAKKISQQSFHYVSTTTVAKLLTIITSDVDGIKGLISQVELASYSVLLKKTWKKSTKWSMKASLELA